MNNKADILNSFFILPLNNVLLTQNLDEGLFRDLKELFNLGVYCMSQLEWICHVSDSSLV